MVASSWKRFSVAAAFLVAAGAFLSLRSRAEVIPAHKSLAEFPEQIARLARSGSATFSGNSGCFGPR